MEDKQGILNLLLKALQATRDLHDLVSLDYESTSGLEIAIAKFASGVERDINITHDSGIALIRDVVSYLD